MTVETGYEEKPDADDIPPLPKALDQKIKLNKDAEALGLQADIEEDSLNGMIVRSLTKDGTLARDGKIQPGDYLVAVNGENMRNISHSQALAVLRRAQAIPLGEEISITYIPASDAVVFRTTILTRVACGEEIDRDRRSRSQSVERTGQPLQTVISISSKQKQDVVQAPLVSPETDMSPDASTSVKMKKSFDQFSIKSVTTDESSTDPEPTALSRQMSPPEAAPRTSVRSLESKQSSFQGDMGVDSLSVSREDLTGSNTPSSPSKHWGPKRSHEMFRTGNQGLGISIVGGKVDSSHSSDASALTGIFIKNVLEGSPTAELDCLNTGDRILAVGDVDLRTASHDMAVEAIRQARNPLKLTVQSLRQYTIESDHVSQETPFKHKDKEPEQHNLTVTGDLDRTLGGEEVVLPATPHLSPQRDFSSCKVTPPDGFKSLFPDPTLKTPPTPSPRSSRSLDLSHTNFPKAESI